MYTIYILKILFSTNFINPLGLYTTTFIDIFSFQHTSQTKPKTMSTAATIKTQSHKGKNNVITAPTPKAIKNSPIVFLNAPTNILPPCRL